MKAIATRDREALAARDMTFTVELEDDFPPSDVRMRQQHVDENQEFRDLS